MRPRHQSPVDIPADAPRHQTGIEWSYRPTPLVLGDDPAAVQVDCALGSSLVIDGQRFELEQFHFHCPGEHTFEGARSPMELHLVHRSRTDDLTVTGVMFVEDAPNAALEPILAALAGLQRARRLAGADAPGRPLPRSIARARCHPPRQQPAGPATPRAQVRVVVNPPDDAHGVIPSATRPDGER